MSFSAGSNSTNTPTGAGSEIESILRQMIEQYLNGMQVSSAGDESRAINKTVFLPEVTGFGSVIDGAIQSAVDSRVQEGTASATPSIGGGGFEDTESLTEAQGVGLARQGLSALQNPEVLIGEGLSKLPHAVLVAFGISLIPIIIQELTKPGGPFDLRFKRIVEKEFNSLMDRQTAHDIAIGERGIIIQSRQGFINRNGALTNTNTLRTIREGGINKDVLNEVDYIDHSRGLY